MALGYGNPLGFQLGGGLTAYERTYLALRRAMGEGGPGPIGGVEDEWRKAKAMVIARTITLAERAFYESLPGWATSSIAAWEETLAIDEEPTLAARQIAAQTAFTKRLDFSVPQMRADLQTIDSGLDVLEIDHDVAITTQLGQPFTSTWIAQWVAYASEHVCTVVWSGLIDGLPDPVKLAQVERYLGELPAWVDWRLVNGVGFYLDGANDSRLDLTAFGDSG